MIILLILFILCHLTSLICNLFRSRSIPEIIVPIIGIICSGLAFIPSIFIWGLSFSFVCFPLALFLNTIRYGQTHLDTKAPLQHIVYGASGLGVLATLIGGTIWSCI